MPILTSLRQSPTYLYVKVYCLCALVTLFQAAPVSSRIPRLGQTLQLNKYRLIRTRLGPRIVPVEEAVSLPTSSDASPAPSSVAPASKEVVISSDVLGSAAQGSVVRKVLARWWQRARDLAQVKQLLRADTADLKAYPEIEWDATVRRSSSLHPEEVKFLRKRQERLSSQGQGCLQQFLELPASENVDPRDVPLLALGGSGGGYRAMYGFAGFIAAAKRSGLWDCVAWAGGVSGSCWTLAAYYTIAYQDVNRLVRHYLAVASELAHPMSVHALDTVARSSRGVYFLLGPLIRKAQAGIVGLRIMDLYATLTTTYQFLSREPRARLSRASFQFSKVWSRSGVSSGCEPLPIFTAVRVAPQDAPGVRPHTDSLLSKGQPPKRALSQHQTAASKALTEDSTLARTPTSEAAMSQGSLIDGRTDVFAVPAAKGYFQWFEATPLEVGSADVQGYIPTWAWGRPFVSGRSLDRRPEQSLSLLLGQCTSAPAGPLTGYISALLASLPKGTAMSRILLFLNNFVRMKRWERRWGNPIRAGDEPNPFYGLNVSPVSQESSNDPIRPSVLGIGIDILHLPRLKALVHRRKNRRGTDSSDRTQRDDKSYDEATQVAMNRLARRILCDSERREFEQLAEEHLDTAEGFAHLEKYIANRWCAKEAAYKALYPKFVVSWKDLCVHKPGSHGIPASPIDGVRLSLLELQGFRTMKPVLTFSEEWRTKHPGVASVPKLHLSLSHDGEYVVANVLAEDVPASCKNESNATRTSEWSELDVKLPPSVVHEATALENFEDGTSLVLGRSSDLAGSVSPVAKPQDHTVPSSWETAGRIRLMDSGMSNNMPNHILARKERTADIIIAFDASSDVQAGSAMQRIHNFADDCHLTLTDQTHLFDPITPASNLSTETSKEMEAKFLSQYARVLQGTRNDDGSAFWLIYCPLLPNPRNEAYDPSTSPFSNSYNLVWTPAQVQTLLTTSEANLEVYALQMIKQVVRKVYFDKKAARLASALAAEQVGQRDPQ